MTVPVLDGLRDVADDYDALVLDLWGVVHDGISLFPGVHDALERLRAAGKRLVFLSNAPRRAEVVTAQLEGFGIDRALHDGVVSSGEISWQHLAQRPDDWYLGIGRACLWIGPKRDGGMLESLDVDVVDTVEAADFLLVTGPENDGTLVVADDERLAPALARGLPMICANPDREVIRGGTRQLCAGAVAEYYERLGGDVRWHGKPDPSIYADCFRMLGIGDRTRILGVGDSFATDIRGANAAGLDALLVARGIHGADLVDADGALDGARIARDAEAAGVELIGAIREFVW